MEEESEFRHWDKLIPDALGLIFKKLSLQEILTVIPRVCKSWGRAVNGPYCWQDIDIEQWSRQRWNRQRWNRQRWNRQRWNRQQWSGLSETLDRMLQMLVTRSSGSLRKLCVTGLSSDQMFSFIADNAKSLQTLRVPRSEISDSIVEQVAGRLSSVTYLDVSHCTMIGAPALEAIGKNCKSLMGLRRKMFAAEVIDLSPDDEALAIATTMPKLKQLQMKNLLDSTEGVLKILENCPELELLDVRGCLNVKLDDNFVKQFSRLKVVGPRFVGYFDDDSNQSWADELDEVVFDWNPSEWNDYDGIFSDEEIFDVNWEDGPNMEDAEMRLYDDGFDIIQYVIDNVSLSP